MVLIYFIILIKTIRKRLVGGENLLVEMPKTGIMREDKENVMSIVSIETAGDHKFNVPHIRRSGGEELIQLLLEKAELSVDLFWRVRINKKQQCSGLTSPVSVIRYNEWGVYMMIKPGDNDSCHNVTLLVPKGLRSDDVFCKLKKVEKLLSRNWRWDKSMVNLVNQPETEVTTTIINEVKKDVRVVEEEPLVEDIVTANQKFDLGGYMKEIKNIKAICRGVYSLNHIIGKENNKNFMEELCKILGIELTSHQGGAMMRAIVARGLACRRVNSNNVLIGYDLTNKGLELAEINSIQSTAVSVNNDNCAKIIRELGTVAQDIVSASVRLQEIHQEREQLEERLAVLKKEEQEICQLIGESEINKFVTNLRFLI